MVVLLPCPLVAAEEACAAGFSGRLSYRGCAASGTSGHGAIFGGAPRRRRPFLAAPNGCRAMDARYDAGQISAHERPGSDLQSAAKLRLHALISRVQGDGEQEMLEDILLSEPPESKILLSLLSGGVICAGALLVCWLSGSSPSGGAHLSLESGKAFAVGLIAGSPLAALKAGVWSDAARRAYPALQDMQQKEADALKPLLHSMSMAQVAVVMAAEALPSLLMLLPAAQGALTLSLGTYAEYLRDAGFVVPYNLPSALALITTASMAALARYLEHGISSEEFEAVDAASKNADRYYRLMGGAGAPGKAEDAERMARAFKVEAANWVHRQRMAGHVAALLAAFEVTFLGLLWKETGDLAAPAAACLLLHGVGFASLHKFAFRTKQQ